MAIERNYHMAKKRKPALYDVSLAAVSQHIKHIYEDGELTPQTTIKKYLTVQKMGLIT